MRARSRAALAVPALVVAACGITGGDAGRTPCDEGLCAGGTLVWGARAASPVGSRVTAVAIAPGDPPWFAGTYDEIISVSIRSEGGDGAGDEDVFLGRTGIDQLEPYLGTATAAYPLRSVGVVPDFEDGATVVLVGQQADTRHRVEAVRFDRQAQRSARVTVALVDAVGALGGVAASTDARGWPIVAISGTRIDLGGIIHDGPRAVVLRLGQGLAAEPILDPDALPGVEIASLAADGDLIGIGGSYSGQPAGWPACATTCGFVGALGAGGGLRWIQSIEAVGGAQVHAVGVGGGMVVAMASAASAPTSPAIGTGPLPAYLLSFGAGADGQPILLDQTVLVADGNDVAGRALAVTDDGDIIVALAFNGTALVGSQPVTVTAPPGTHGSVVAELGTDLLWAWSTLLPRGTDAADTVEVTSVTVEGKQVGVGGRYLGTLDVADPVFVGTPDRADVLNGFALELYR